MAKATIYLLNLEYFKSERDPIHMLFICCNGYKLRSSREIQDMGALLHWLRETIPSHVLYLLRSLGLWLADQTMLTDTLFAIFNKLLESYEDKI
jgi:hypothetical protein